MIVQTMRRAPHLARAALAALIGMTAGVGSYTFHYGKGLSYFSGAPESCANCHIMQPHYDTWLKSSHHAVTTCSDCHLPARLPHSLLAKAENGWNHSWAFTFQDFHEPICMTARNARILQANCVRCHAGLVHEMLAADGGDPPGDPAGEQAPRCVHCHAGAGHTLPPR